MNREFASRLKKFRNLVFVSILGALAVAALAPSASAAPTYRWDFSWGGYWSRDSLYPTGVAVQADGTILAINGRSIDGFSPQGRLMSRADIAPVGDNPLIAVGGGRTFLADDFRQTVSVFPRKNGRKGPPLKLEGAAGADPFGTFLGIGAGDRNLTVLDVLEDSVIPQNRLRVQVMRPSGALVSSWSPVAPDHGIGYVFGMTTDSTGDVYIVDVSATSQLEVLRFDSTGNFLGSWTGKTVVPDQRFGFDYFRVEIAVAPDGAVVLSNFVGSENSISRFSPSGEPDGSWPASRPARALAVAPDGTVVVAIPGNDSRIDHAGSIERYSKAGTFLNTWNGAAIPDSKGLFVSPWALARGPKGRIYVLDAYQYDDDAISGRIKVFSRDGKWLQSFDGGGRRGLTRLIGAKDLAVNRRGVISVANGTRIDRFSTAGRYLSGFNVDVPGGCPGADAVAVDSRNRIVTLHAATGCVARFDQAGRLLRRLTFDVDVSEGWGGATDIAVTRRGRIYMLLENDPRGVTWLRKNGTYGGSWGDIASADKIRNPSALALDSRGHVFVSDGWSSFVYRFGGEGRKQTMFGGRGKAKNELLAPVGLAVTPDGRRVYVSNSGNSRIKVFRQAHKR